jgi:molybdopterin converting factor small subunit
MRIDVQCFARLRDLAGGGRFDSILPDGATVADVWTDAVTRHPALGPFKHAVSCAVNDEFARPTTRLHEGDRVAFLPPVSGG